MTNLRASAIILPLGLLVLAGCQPHHWVDQTGAPVAATAAAFSKADFECQMAVRSSRTPEPSTVNNTAVAVINGIALVNQAGETPMQRGIRRWAKNIEEGRLYRSCMGAAGYARVPVPK